ncbi:neo-calmodulin [Eurytemora carolleeae]|uniref:neo-calmodulin n=1 Tax=Eurytemora carolleeae TaxID=1294199 RepID=UPI000C769941|nr:neo-calmodulin [Eurytemora carolleeae]|eukprot:XP_023338541.1 neo-calmodulin-like [Eurytemora affinis]
MNKVGNSSMDELLNAEFKEAFDEFDKDGSGTISTKELLGVMRSMGQNPTEDELLALVMEVDLNGDGTIDFPEFLEMMKQKSSEADQEADLKEAFKIFDRDKDGFIDMKELKKVANMLGAMLSKEEVDDFMKEADVDGNGKLDYDEFVKMMLQY